MKTLGRHYTIYVIHHSVTGMTDRPEIIFNRQMNYLSQAILLSERLEAGELPKTDDFVWVCESFRVVEAFWEEASEELRQRFINAVRRGHIELTGSYLAMTELADMDTLSESLRRSKRFAKDHEIPLHCAMSADGSVPGWGYASALADTGLDCLYTCGGLSVSPMQRPFLWETAEGKQVLVWHGPHSRFANELGIVPGAAFSGQLKTDGRDAYEGMDETKQQQLALDRVFEYLASLEDAGYPYDFVPVSAAGFVLDNAPPRIDISSFLYRWNRMYSKEVTIKMCTLAEFFSKLEPYRDSMPVMRGDWPDNRSEIIPGAPGGVALFRKAERKLQALERLPERGAVAGKETEDIRRNLLLYAGLADRGAFTRERPEPDVAGLIATRKLSYAAGADRQCDEILIKARRKLGEISPGVENVNELSFAAVSLRQTAGPVCVCCFLYDWETMQLRHGFTLVDQATDKILPAQLEKTIGGYQIRTVLQMEPGEERNLVLRVEKKVSRRPLRGKGYAYQQNYTRFRKEPEKHQVTITDNFIETESLKISWGTEGLCSWFDKQSGVDWLAESPTAFVPLLQHLPVNAGEDLLSVRRRLSRGGDGVDIIRNFGKLVKVEQIIPGEPGGLEETRTVATEIAFTFDLPGFADCLEVLRIYHDGPRADLRVRFHKSSVQEPESLYLSVPFASADSILWAEKSGGMLRPGIDQLPGTRSHYSCLQNGFGLLQEDGKGFFAFCMPDSPLLWTGDYAGGLHVNDAERQGSAESRYVMLMNNYAESDFNCEAGGSFQFNFRMESGTGVKTPERLRMTLADINTDSLCFRTK